MSKRTQIKAAIFAAVAAVMGTFQLQATETENLDFKILPVPGKVVIDGKFDDWDLSGSIFICSDVETYRDQFASWQSAMYDKDNLYLLTRWLDTNPMNNPGLAGTSMGFQGDCLQVRIVATSSGKADNENNDKKHNQRTTHVTAWRGRKGNDLIDLAYGRGFNEGGVKDAKKVGAQQAFIKDADDKGYVQEIAIPWKLLTPDGKAPGAGGKVVMTYEPNFSTDSKMRISTKDLFKPGVTPDRVFAFMASPCWGAGTLEGSGKVQPLSVRLADGRKFAVTMEKGIPVINWKGLYKEDKTEGFAKINLNMPEDGVVSLIIKNSEGQVVRNLINAKFMTKGPQEVLWDGLTNLSHRKPGNPVPAGDYTWEAIYHKGINLTLVGWASNAGRAPFDSPKGNWGGDMADPRSVASDKDSVYLGWGFSEAGKAVVCTDFDGNVKWRHKRGGFGGAALLAADNGNVYVYDSGQGNVVYRLDAKKGDYVNWQGTEEATLSLTPILAKFQDEKEKAAKDKNGKSPEPKASGMAAVGGKLFLSYGSLGVWPVNQTSGNILLMLDGITGKVLKEIKVEDPRDLKVGQDGKLYLIKGDNYVAIVDTETGAVADVVKDLKSARCVAADKDGNIYVGVTEPDNQIKVFDKTGKALRTIGKQGGRPLLGEWDPSGMLAISGITVDVKGNLWVMESDGTPRRISVWNAGSGAFVKELFGPTHYGAGGGAISPDDPYTMIGMGCEWKLDKETGRAKCVGVIFRGKWHNARFGTGKDGRVYAAVGGGWPNREPVLIFERLEAGKWKLRTTITPGQTKENSKFKNVIVWADKNNDEKQQPDEVKDYEIDLNGWIDGWYMPMNQKLSFAGGQYRIDVTGWTSCGAPEYDLSKAKKLPIPDDLNQRGGMGAQRGMVSADNNYVIYNGHYGTSHSDFPVYDIRTGKKVFAYPNNYVGVHGGHNAPPVQRGLISGAYDIVGTVKQPAPLDNLFVIGTDKGEWHLLSSSGYYVSKLFEGNPMKIKWPAESIPGANINTTPPGMGAEDFGGSVILANDGTMYVQAGKTAFINNKVSGLDTVKVLGKGKLKITPKDTLLAQEFKVKYLSVGDEKKSTTVKKKSVVFKDSPNNDFGNKEMSYGDELNKISTWMAYDDTNLYVAWRVNDKTPWVNGSTGYENLYAGGDTVDLQIGTDSKADPKRRGAVKGDLRLSIGRLGGKDTAVLYRKVSDEKAPKTFYSGTCKEGYKMELVKKLDNVKIKTRVDKGQYPSYTVQAAIPLQDLGLNPKAGLKLRGDVGVTYSDPEGKDTNMRVYWANKATGLVADEVVELKMQPDMWGELTFE